jgi:hypothetical protein
MALVYLSAFVRFYHFAFSSLWLEYQSSNFTFSWKRFLIVSCLLFGFPVLLSWNHLGFFFDDLFFPNWRKQEIITPIFIVGNARSGTTWLHRLMVSTLDKQFTSLKTWEIFFAPSVTWRILFHTLYYLDQHLGFASFYQILLYLERILIPKSSLHEIGLNMAEEDEWLMIHISSAQLMCFFFPCGGEVLNSLISFDAIPFTDPNSLPIVEKMMIFNYYKECVQRHLYTLSFLSNRSKPIFVSKNPAFTLRIHTLFSVFPDCKIICLLRDPIESIPSMVSYIGTVCLALFSSPSLRKIRSFISSLHLFSNIQIPKHWLVIVSLTISTLSVIIPSLTLSLNHSPSSSHRRAESSNPLRITVGFLEIC